MDTQRSVKPLMVWVTDADRHCRYVNEAWGDFIGHGPDPSAEADWMEGVHESDRAAVEQRRNAAALDRQPFECEYRIQRHDGEIRWVLETGSPRFAPDGTFEGYIGSCIDITERKLAEERLRLSASHDALTGLPNRAHFMGLLDRAWRHSREHTDERYALLYIDIDRFKRVNDTLGHAAGDALLHMVAQRLKSCVGENDTVARLGGDEFIILMPGVRDETHALRTAERIVKAFSAPMPTVSVGVALSSTPHAKPDDLIRYADAAMYQAKASGGACCKAFDPSPHP